MDAIEYFCEVVKPNYQEHLAEPDDFRMLWNALVAMNTMAEFIALHRIGYAEMSRDELSKRGDAIRDQNLVDLKHCVNNLKHVRSIKDTPKQPVKFSTVATSTGISGGNPMTWTIGSHDLAIVCHKAFATLTGLPELQKA